MKNIHPDYVAGEPVPRVEPRVDPVKLEYAKGFLLWARWATGLLVVLLIVYGVLGVSIWVRGITLGVLVIGAVVFAIRPKQRAMKKHSMEHQKDKWALPFRIWLETQFYGMFFILFAQGLMSPSDGVSGMATYLGILMIVDGAALVILRFRAREPGQICCEECSYELVGLTLPCMCPECGSSLLDVSFTTDRPRVRSAWFFRVGMPMVPIGFAVIGFGIVRPSVFYGPVPKSVLIPLAVSDRGAFKQLMTKKLDGDEQDRLENGIIDAYRRGGRVPIVGQGQWISDQAAAGLLDEAQLELLFGEIEEIWIDADRVAKVGDSVEIRIGIEDKFFLNATMYPGYYFHGFSIGDDSALYGGSVFERYWVSLKYQDNGRRRNMDSGPPRFVFVPEDSGEVLIRAKVVMVYYDAIAKGNASFGWGMDGEPVFEPEPSWYRVIDLEHRLNVKP